jgi:hypothetical protein
MITKAYLIFGSRYVRYDAMADSVDPGYPKPIAGNWAGFSEIGFQDNLDAAAEWPNGKVYFFKGNQYARYDIAGNRIDSGYPLSIESQWAGFSAAGLASDINAAVNWGNGKVYFFKGNQYLRYDIAADRIDDGFPRPIAAGWPTLANAGFGANLSATWTRVGDPSADTNFNYLTDDFFRKFKQVCSRLSCAPEDLLGVMESESGVKPSAQNPRGKATGLIQFMPDTLTGLGWRNGPDEFQILSAEEQLPFIEKYFAPHVSQGLGSAGRLYQTTFLPATFSGSQESTVIAAPEGPNSSAYKANPLLDSNRDGKITVSDLTARIDSVRRGTRWEALLRRLAAT